jgi:intein/homing endonuclease
MKKLDDKITIGIFELSKLGFYAELKEKFRESIKEKIYKKFGSLKNFSTQTKIIRNCYLSSVLKASAYTRLDIWLKICATVKVSPEKLKENTLKFRKKKSEHFLSPEQLPILSSPKLASLVGHGIGDGHISGEGCFEYTNGNLNLHKNVLDIISKLFGFYKYSEYEHKVKKRRFNVIVGEILHFAGVPKGNKIIQSFPTPRWILNGSKEIKKSFIRALFDDEGTVKVSSHEILIKFSKNEKYIDSLQKFMEQIKQLLEDLGIEVTSIRKENIGKNGRTIQLVLGIHGYKNFIKFSEEIKFHHKQKQRKTERMIKNYTSFQNRKGVTQKMLYQTLSKPLTIHELMSMLNMTYMTVYKSIKKLEDKGLIKRIGYNREQCIIWNKL